MAKNPAAKTGYKRPPADHEILLTMAIADPGYMVNMPQGATGASGKRRLLRDMRKSRSAAA